MYIFLYNCFAFGNIVILQSQGRDLGRSPSYLSLRRSKARDEALHHVIARDITRRMARSPYEYFSRRIRKRKNKYGGLHWTHLCINRGEASVSRLPISYHYHS